MSGEHFEHKRAPERLTDQELVVGYRQGEVAGQEVMGRLLQKIGLKHRGDEQLMRRDGSVFTGADGQPLRMVDYLEAAAEHPDAIPYILGFTAMDESHERYPASKEFIHSVVSGYLPPEPDPGRG